MKGLADMASNVKVCHSNQETRYPKALNDAAGGSIEAAAAAAGAGTDGAGAAGAAGAGAEGAGAMAAGVAGNFWHALP